MSTQRHILEATNLGPIHHARLELQPGINELLGENGAGKTNLFNATQKALGNDEVGVTVRDGAAKGTLSIDGMPVLLVGKANKRTGHTDISLASTSPLSTLVEPGIKDADAADKARVSALLKLVDCPVTEDAILALVDGDGKAYRYIDDNEGIEALKRLDIVLVADRVRRRVHDLKRQYESEAVQAEAESIAHTPEKPKQLVEESIEDAQFKYEASVRTLERLSGEASSRAAREKERKEIEATIGRAPDVEKAKRDAREASAYVTSCAETVSGLTLKLAAAEAELRTSVKARDTAEKALDTAKAEAENYDKRKGILESEIAGATYEDVASAEDTVEANRRTLAAARESQAYREALEKQKAAKDRRDIAKEFAEHYEDIAIHVTGQLGNIFSALGLKNLTVDDSSLSFVHEDGRLESFSRLSFGQRTRIAAELAAKKYDEGQVVALDGKYWMALSPENKRETAEIYENQGLFVLTERPSDGELRVEHFEVEEAA